MLSELEEADELEDEAGFAGSCSTSKATTVFFSSLLTLSELELDEDPEVVGLLVVFFTAFVFAAFEVFASDSLPSSLASLLPLRDVYSPFF